MTEAERRRCYVASPLGFTEAGRAYYTDVYLPALRAVVDVVDPWALTSADEVAAATESGNARVMMLEIARRNSEAIATCSMMAAYLEGQEVDAGTAAEIGYGVALGLRCFGLRSDLREAGEEGVAVNLQVEGLIVQSGGRVVRELAALVTALGEND